MVGGNSLDGFPWDGNRMLEIAYNNDNYKIIDTGSKSNRVIIFFSGNGLYTPNEENVFCKKIIEDDRYEWQNISSSKLVRNYYGKIILIRDIYKQWYVNGINSKLNSIDTVIKFIEKVLDDGTYSVTTCGNSAGGYMASIVGIRLNAERIFTF